MSCKKHTKKAVPLLKGDENFFLKKVRRGFFIYRTAITRATREKPLRLKWLRPLIHLPLKGRNFFNYSK